MALNTQVWLHTVSVGGYMLVYFNRVSKEMFISSMYCMHVLQRHTASCGCHITNIGMSVRAAAPASGEWLPNILY